MNKYNTGDTVKLECEGKVVIEHDDGCYVKFSDGEAIWLTTAQLNELTAPVPSQPRFDWELFSSGNQAVNCHTEHDAEVFLAWLARKGVRWCSGDEATEFTSYDHYGKETCYTLSYLEKGIRYSHAEVCLAWNITTIPFTREMLAEI